jgi:hypothetical protein
MHGASEKYIHVVGKSEGRRPRGRPRCRWEDGDKNLEKIGLEVGDWIYVLGWNLVVGLCDHGNESSGPMKGSQEVHCSI